MANKNWEIARIIFAILVIILSILTIILLIIKLSGHSPDSITILSLTITSLIALQILILTILFQVKGDIGELKEFKRQTITKIKYLEEA